MKAHGMMGAVDGTAALPKLELKGKLQGDFEADGSGYERDGEDLRVYRVLEGYIKT